MENEPFQPEDVLYRFTPTEKQRAGFRAEEYALVRDPENGFGFSLWVRYREKWLIGYHEDRVLVARLLADLFAITAERNVYQQALERYAEDHYGIIARAVLAQGKKLRGEGT